MAAGTTAGMQPLAMSRGAAGSGPRKRTLAAEYREVAGYRFGATITAGTAWAPRRRTTLAPREERSVIPGVHPALLGQSRTHPRGRVGPDTRHSLRQKVAYLPQEGIACRRCRGHAALASERHRAVVEPAMTARAMSPAEPPGSVLPGFVRGWCCKAGAGTLQRGFEDVGYLVATHLRALRPAAVPPRSWRRQVRLLEEHVAAGNQSAVQRWFHAHCPPLMRLIPRRRQRDFARGFIQRAGEPTTVPATGADA